MLLTISYWFVAITMLICTIARLVLSILRTVDQTIKLITIVLSIYGCHELLSWLSLDVLIQW